MADPEEFYTAHAEEQHRAMRDANVSDRFIEFRQEFADMVFPGEVLDAGCGPGRHTAFLRDEGLTVTGVDAAPGAVDAARDRYGGDFRVMDLRDLGFGNGRFDGVFCSASIMFMPPEEMRTALSEIRRVMGKRSTLYINFKIGDGPREIEKWGSSVTRYRVSVHEARAMLEDADLAVVREGTDDLDANNGFADFICESRH